MSTDTVTITSTHHAIEIGDSIHMSLPHPPWWKPVAIWRWWRMRDKAWRVTHVSNTTMTRES